MVSFAQIACLPPLLMLSHFEVDFPSAMTQGSEATFSGPQNYLFIILLVYSPLFLAQVPSQPQTSTAGSGSPLCRLPESRCLGLGPLHF